MSLLRDIQSSAVDANEPIGSLLRKCKILAARLGSQEFKDWIEHELNGFSDKDNFPKYRIMSVHCKGNFSGGFGSSMNNAEIPRRCIPEEFREGLFTSYFSQPVSAIESLINDSDGGTAQEPWPTDVTVHFGENIYQGMNCLEAWKVIPVNALVGMLDVIRNKVLNFVLEIESEDPQAGDAPINSQPVAEKKVEQIFHTHISGNVQNLATGSSSFKQHAVSNEQNEVFNQLLESLSKTSDHQQSKKEIIGIVEDMRDSKEPSNLKENYTKFMSVLSDHFQVYGPVVAPFLPALAEILP